MIDDRNPMRTSRRPNGAGTIECIRGRWRVRAFVDGKRTTIGWRDTREAAEALLVTWGVDKGLYAAPSGQTLGTFGTEWLDRRERDGSERRERVRSIHTERSAWRRHVLGTDLADSPLADITPAAVVRFSRELATKRASHVIVTGPITARVVDHRDAGRLLSRSSQRHVMRLVRQALDAAVIDGAITVNPAAGIGPRPSSRRERDLSDDWLRAGEIDRLLAAEALDLRLRTAYACAIGLALRLGDLKALEVGHVHLDAEVPGPHVRVWVQKSERWHRVPVLPWLAPWLRAHLDGLPEGARFLFSPDRDHQTPYAKHYDFRWAASRETQRNTLRGALERAGVGRKVRFHDLRGTTATHLALGTWGRAWSLHEIQGMLAHSDQRVTERYVRRAIDVLAEAARQTVGRCPPLPTGRGVSATPPPGIEPGAVRLEERGQGEWLRSVAGERGQHVGSVGELTMLATRLDAACQSGAVSSDLLHEVLDAARAHPVVAAFVAAEAEVEAGGPHALRRAVALLSALTTGASVERARIEREGSEGA